MFLANSAGHVRIPAERTVAYTVLTMKTETDSWAFLLLMNTNVYKLSNFVFRLSDSCLV